MARRAREPLPETGLRSFGLALDDEGIGPRKEGFRRFRLSRGQPLKDCAGFANVPASLEESPPEVILPILSTLSGCDLEETRFEGLLLF